MEVKEWHRSSVYHCECKQKSKSGGSLGNEAIIVNYSSFFRWTSGVLEWLCLSVSLARDRSFMETLQWPLDGEWVWKQRRGKGGECACDRE